MDNFYNLIKKCEHVWHAHRCASKKENFERLYLVTQFHVSLDFEQFIGPVKHHAMHDNKSKNGKRNVN